VLHDDNSTQIDAEIPFSSQQMHVRLEDRRGKKIGRIWVLLGLCVIGVVRLILLIPPGACIVCMEGCRAAGKAELGLEG